MSLGSIETGILGLLCLVLGLGSLWHAQGQQPARIDSISLSLPAAVESAAAVVAVVRSCDMKKGDLSIQRIEVSFTLAGRAPSGTWVPRTDRRDVWEVLPSAIEDRKGEVDVSTSRRRQGSPSSAFGM